MNQRRTNIPVFSETATRADRAMLKASMLRLALERLNTIADVVPGTKPDVDALLAGIQNCGAVAVQLEHDLADICESGAELDRFMDKAEAETSTLRQAAA